MNVTKLQIYGIGVVAANKILSSKNIEVTPIEDLPFLDGEITDNVTTLNTKGKTSSGSSYETSIDVTATINAEWLPICISNRVTAPDVRRGEKVIIYRYGETDKYYWTTLEYDMKLRKLETVIFAFSNTQEESKDGQSDTTYFFEVSTHKKLVTFHTSKSDGEPYTYTFQLNTADGNFVFQDDIGNFISLDSKNIRIEAKNADGTWIDMDRKDIKMYAPDSIYFEAEKSINLKAGESINHQTKHITTKADDTINTVPSTRTTGNVKVNQNLTVDMVTTTSGLSSISAPGANTRGPISGSQVDVDNLTVSGNANVAGVASVGKLVSQQDISAPNV